MAASVTVFMCVTWSHPSTSGRFHPSSAPERSAGSATFPVSTKKLPTAERHQTHTTCRPGLKLLCINSPWSTSVRT
ncbi:hypothetical protein VTJ04DRAFT_4879 [Mycothermus thermophilus]|uniref:uncharacterized protein n=1 Tax=Humicola insolens TaxID=85995 RepID=UPI0037438006